MRLLMIAFTILAVSASAGCGMTRNIFYPGSIEQQQRFATLHDPYPDNVAGPEVVGGRPLSFANPQPEPVRSDYARNYFMFGR
ncbi:membrane or secreted protein [Lignipirellula cremea]|uniref:Lipoprotein n=1 Tax=Lignipirellula cremea TaxID=2528010 RepID=A0A518DW87_9BACT|nr:membrane or secreted protein [Lignipirellula cremea]QDU96097.1 hypothetical protein Pla8534_39160 [Lignipirellula cremea]